MSTSTKTKLANAILQLLNRQTLDKITVQDIANAAGVSRKTFYYHFQDIYDLLEWMLDQERLALTPAQPEPDAWQMTLKGLLQFCLNNRTAIQNLYHSLERDSLERYTGSVIRNCITYFSLIGFDDALRKEDRFRMVLDFYTYGLQGLLLSWIGNGMYGNPDQILKDVNVMLVDIANAFHMSATQ